MCTKPEVSVALLSTLLAGWAFRFKTVPDGRRQILNFLLPGDFIGLQQEFADGSGHGVEALTDTALCVFPRDGLWDLFRQFPSLGYDLTWLAAREEGMLVGISSGATLAAIAQKLPELPAGSRVLGFNYDTGERYLSIEGFLPA